MSEEINEGVIKEYINTLPQKFLDLGLSVLFSFVFFFIGVRLIRLIRKLVKKGLTKAKVDTGVIQFTDSLLNLLLSGVLILIIGVNFGLEATSIATLISSVSIALGLAMQGSLSNFAGGVLILVLKPFKVGDYIKENATNNEGCVKEINLFYTKLLTVDNRVIILPNGTLANSSMINYTDNLERRTDIRVEISYEADIKTAKRTLKKVVDDNKSVKHDMPVEIFVSQMGPNGVELGVRCYINTAEYMSVYWQLLEDIKYALDEAGITIPYQQVDIHMINN